MAPKGKASAKPAAKPRGASGEAVPPAGAQLLLLKEVTACTRLSDTTLWRLEKLGRFPKRIKIGLKRVAWRAAEIDAWIAGAAAGAVAEKPEAA